MCPVRIEIWLLSGRAFDNTYMSEVAGFINDNTVLFNGQMALESFVLCLELVLVAKIQPF